MESRLQAGVWKVAIFGLQAEPHARCLSYTIFDLAHCEAICFLCNHNLSVDSLERSRVMTRVFALALLLLALSITSLAQTSTPTLYQKPAVNRTHIVFVYAGDLWIVPREGGDAKRLTTGVGIETDPHFSPDGAMIAFTGEYDGNTDVYVIPAAGGVPKRLTYHPGADRVVGWTPDGKQIIFSSTRNSTSN